MRILLSAFACSPAIGSEPLVGWEWASRLSARHDVTVVTHGYFRSAIEQALAARPRPGLRFEFHEVPWLRIHPHRALNSRVYYLLWQLTVARRIAALARERGFDLFHHLTWGSFRLPSFVGFVGRPFVVGPVGGGERSPVRLRRSMPIGARVFELARDLLIASGKFDPFLRLALSRTDVILAKTLETLGALPASARRRAHLAHEVGASAEAANGAVRPASGDGLRILFAGRLIPAKGVHLALYALARLVGRHERASLHIAGDGPLRGSLERQAAALGIERHVTFLGMLPRERLMETYRDMDCFLFPSLHDSSGNVVLEALARGLPVVCLDLGGPRYFVDETCGTIVGTRGRSEAAVAEALAEALKRLGEQPAERARLSAGAQARARVLGWDNQILRAYALIEQQLAAAGGRRAATPGRQA
jgi:glycosyltransferase involved in cell wall biosynthesis